MAARRVAPMRLFTDETLLRPNMDAEALKKARLQGVKLWKSLSEHDKALWAAQAHELNLKLCDSEAQSSTYASVASEETSRRNERHEHPSAVATSEPVSLSVNVEAFVIQASWDEEDDQELLDFLHASSLPLTVAEESDVLTLTPSLNTMVFADTDLIQQMVDASVVPDTYPVCFSPLYKRRISKGMLSSLEESSLPLFVKPATTHKAFSARVLRSFDDLEAAKHEAVGDVVYMCEVVDFVSEHRIFLGPDKVWGIRDYSDFMLCHRVANSVPGVVLGVERAVPPSEFIFEVVEAATRADLGFIVVDVGLTSRGQWAVVEANPPFALSSYSLDIATYVNYCCAAWQYVLTMQRSRTALKGP